MKKTQIRKIPAVFWFWSACCDYENNAGVFTWTWRAESQQIKSRTLTLQTAKTKLKGQSSDSHSPQWSWKTSWSRMGTGAFCLSCKILCKLWRMKGVAVCGHCARSMTTHVWIIMRSNSFSPKKDPIRNSKKQTNPNRVFCNLLHSYTVILHQNTPVLQDHFIIGNVDF